jgi:flagellar biosynthesis protein FlhG
MKPPRLGRGLRDLRVWPVPVPDPVDPPPSGVGRIGAPVGAPLPASATAWPSSPPRRPAVVCITSGKGGTGKSVIASNLSVHLAGAGSRVVVVDADLGLANQHLLLGLRPERSIVDVIERGVPIESILEDGPAGVALAAGVSGRPEVADLHSGRLRRLVTAIEGLAGRADVVVVDTGAGIGRATTTFLYAIDDVVLVTTPDLTAMTDGYMMIKNVARNNPRARLSVVVNRVQSAVEGLEVFGRMEQVCRRHLNRAPRFLGHVLEDRRIAASVATRIPILLNQPSAPAAACLRGVGRSLQIMLPTGAGAAPPAVSEQEP